MTGALRRWLAPLRGALALLGTCVMLPTCGKSDPSRLADAGTDMIGDSMFPPPDLGDGPREAGDGREAGDDIDGLDATDAIGGTDAPPMQTLLPLRPGNRWIYQVREPGQASYEKTQMVEAAEAVGGRGPHAGEIAYRMVTTKVGGAFGLPDRTVSWQRSDGTKVVRFRELAYRAGTNTVNAEDYWTPYKLRLDAQPLPAPLALGQRWEERYTEHKVSPTTGAVSSVHHTDVWTVTGVDLDVSVAAGRFAGCAELTKTDGSGTDAGKSYVFCPGVGKVRETGRAGISQSEELTSFAVSP